VKVVAACETLVLSALLLGGCAVRGLPASDGIACPDCAATVCRDRQTLSIDYLGAGGYLLRRDQDVVLLGPFVSNPGMLRAMSLRRMEPNVDALEQWLPDVSQASAIIVGHAHYDHLLDVPWIAEHRAPHAIVYGSQTVAHVLAAVPALEGRVMAIDKAYPQSSKSIEEQWVSIPGTRVRFLPIESAHAAHFAGVKLMAGRLESDLDELPRRARGWVEGRTLAYLIEFLHPSENRALFSLHYQDAASDAPLGFPPPAAGPVDAALVCVASHRRVEGYPQQLLERMQPRHVVLGHWENFLAPHTRDLQALRGVPLSDPRDFIDTVEQYVAGNDVSSWLLPAPGSTLRLVACPGD
jgi:L-ascorbate metabolism protein UlaG (beta-lactamase superfamily)